MQDCTRSLLDIPWLRTQLGVVSFSLPATVYDVYDTLDFDLMGVDGVDSFNPQGKARDTRR